MIPFSELILNNDGSIYHLHLSPGELAEKIILVGDPERVDKVAIHFDSIEFTRQKREFRTITGKFRGQRLSVISTGIGTDNIDIVLTEIDALFNINFDKREPNSNPVSLNFVRFGTCGGLQAENPVGSIVSSAFAVGTEGLMHFYQRPNTSILNQLENDFQSFAKDSIPPGISPYASMASKKFTELLKLEFPEIIQGITFTATGFYGPQGRFVERAKVKSPGMLDHIAKYRFMDMPITNLEMETSGILGMAEALGHEALSLSVILANRPSGEFHPEPASAVEKLIEKGLEIVLKL